MVRSLRGLLRGGVVLPVAHDVEPHAEFGGDGFGQAVGLGVEPANDRWWSVVVEHASGVEGVAHRDGRHLEFGDRVDVAAANWCADRFLLAEQDVHAVLNGDDLAAVPAVSSAELVDVLIQQQRQVRVARGSR